MKGQKKPRKRKESGLITAILEYLQCLENNKSISWVDRLNSGRIFIPNASQSSGNRPPFNARRSGRSIRLCRPGTPDIYVILNNGKMLWIEGKVEDSEIQKEQFAFRELAYKCGHYHLFAGDVDSVKKFIDGIASNSLI